MLTRLPVLDQAFGRWFGRNSIVQASVKLSVLNTVLVHEFKLQ